jgi:hypothetical protein
MLKNLIIISSIFLISGCSMMNSDNQKFLDKKEIKLDSVLYEEPNLNIDKYEAELVRLAGKVEQQRKRYYLLLENRKDLLNKKMKNHIPVGMGKRISIDFQGYLGNFYKILARKSNYELKFQNLTVKDTPIITKKYERTMIFDIIKDISEEYDISLNIIENEQIIEISIKG